ncbi:MAG: sulfurtransferase [Deltaproteobacteria bacterium]|nr:sulfurtransferase [Deltaproteobacteria bacterium]
MLELLISTEWLGAHLGDPQVVVVDTRWYLRGKRGIDEYRAGHLPGAVFLDVDTDLADPPGPGRPGRHPLPSHERFAAALARIGVRHGALVVGYDDEGGAVAARLWWLLRYFGLSVGRVLDGGLAAWKAEGRPLETADAARRPASRLALAPQPGLVVDKRRVVELLREPGTLLLDGRPADRFRGENETVDARPGHIPGAKSAFVGDNLVEPNGRFLAPAALVERFAALGANEAKTVVCYCGSGVKACHDILALTLAGRPDAVLYEGSWSEWAADSGLPAELG